MNDKLENTILYYEKIMCPVDKDNKLSKEEKKEMLLRAKSGDLEAKNKFIEQNLKLVAYVVRQLMCNKKSNLKYSYEELFQQGAIYLQYAYEKYDVSRDSSFEAFASKYIFNHFTGVLKQKSAEKYTLPNYEYDYYALFPADYENEIEISERNCLYEKVNKIIKVGLLKDIIDNPYSKKELEKIFNFCRIYQLFSNDKITYEAKEKYLTEFIVARNRITRGENVDNKELYLRYLPIYRRLVYVDIIIKNIMLPPDKAWSFQKIGDFYGITKQAVARSLNDALTEIRRYIVFNKEEYDGYFDVVSIKSKIKESNKFKNYDVGN